MVSSRVRPDHRRRLVTERHRPPSPRGGRRSGRLGLAAALLLVISGIVPGPADHAGAQIGPWVEPVVAPVVDGYRPPAHIGAPGNRGWEYRTEPGIVVAAAGDGVVVFAGPIGDSLFVSIRHADGHRTTYSHVATVVVAVGDPVLAGTPIATAGERLHFGVRVGDGYRDPGELFAAPLPSAVGAAAGTDARLRLVPAGPGSGVAGAASITAPMGRAAIALPDVPIRRAGPGPRTGDGATPALGRWLATVGWPRSGGAAVTSGWSGAAADTLAAGPEHIAVGP